MLFGFSLSDFKYEAGFINRSFMVWSSLQMHDTDIKEWDAKCGF